MGVLYKLTSPSGKSYIGITSKTLEQRWAKHVEHAFGKRDAGALYGALRKYGVETFKREQLGECDDWERLCQMEKDAIASHGTLSPNGYNLTIGGEGIIGPKTEQGRANIARAQRERFKRPDQQELLRRNVKKMQAANAARRAANPPVPKPRKPRMSKEEHSARTKAAMARPDVKQKTIECARRRAANPDWRAKISAAKTGTKLSPMSDDCKRKISEARRREWADPAMRAKRLAAFSKQHKKEPNGRADNE
jgi:hypothetical protein